MIPMLLATLALPALADDAAPDSAAAETRAEVVLDDPDRLDGAVRLSAFSGAPDLFGVSASVFALRPVVLEVGASAFLFGTSTYARLGVALPIDRPGGSFLVLVEPMLGYRTMTASFAEGRFHAPTGTVALEAVRWFGPAFAVDAQLALGADYWIDWSDQGRNLLLPDVRASAGVAF